MSPPASPRVVPSMERAPAGSVECPRMEARPISLAVSTTILAALLATGCGASDTGSTETSHPGKHAAPGDSKVATSSAADEWKTIITGDWTLDPGMEGYVCARQTLEEDLI